MIPKKLHIRPSPDYLRGLRTLQTETQQDFTNVLRQVAELAGIAVRLELKLRTADFDYWLCTQGATGPGPGIPREWIEGTAIRESRNHELSGARLRDPYDSTDCDLRQDYDELWLVTKQCEELHEEFEETGDPDVEQMHAEAVRYLQWIRDSTTKKKTSRANEETSKPESS